VRDAARSKRGLTGGEHDLAIAEEQPHVALENVERLIVAAVDV
jgi:hypothetical protein